MYIHQLAFKILFCYIIIICFSVFIPFLEIRLLEEICETIQVISENKMRLFTSNKLVVNEI